MESIATMTIPSLSRQEIYDRVKNHLLTQNLKAQDCWGGHCVYRSKSKQSGTFLKCAVGCLIPDELYSASIEGVTVSGILNLLAIGRMERNNNPLLIIFDQIGVKDQDLPLLKALQNIHDKTQPPSWSSGLRSLAFEFNLIP